MQPSHINWSPQVDSVLSRYPHWKKLVIEALDKPFLDLNYCPQVIEIFDQYGLLAGRVYGAFSYECTRTILEESDFTAWLFDGELVVFYVSSFLVINRLQLLTFVEKKLYA